MSDLTKEQQKAARLIAEGLSGRQVAKQIGVASSTMTRWTRRQDFRAKVAHYEALMEAEAKDARREAAAKAVAEAKAATPDLGNLAKQAALQAFGGLVRRMQAGEQIAPGDWARVAGTLQKLDESESDTGLTPAALADALKNPETAAAALDAMEVVDQAALLTALREREVERFKADRDLGAPGVREALIATGRWAPPGVAAVWLARWRNVMELSKADLSRLISRSAHLEVAQQYGDAPDEGYAVIDQRHPVDQIEAVVSAANTPTADKDTDHAPA